MIHITIIRKFSMSIQGPVECKIFFKTVSSCVCHIMEVESLYERP